MLRSKKIRLSIALLAGIILLNPVHAQKTISGDGYSIQMGEMYKLPKGHWNETYSGSPKRECTMFPDPGNR